MGSGGGTKSGGSSTTTNNIPPEYSALSSQTGANVANLQQIDPISQYINPNPAGVAGLSGTQQSSLDLLNKNLSDATKPLEEAPIVGAGQRYFQNSIAPGIVNQATLSGLGRSTALTNALSSSEAQTLLPLFQGEQQRRDNMIGQGLQGGDVERSVEQAKLNAEAQDFIRRQALAEQATFSPLGSLPSTLGQSTVSKATGGGGGLFK